MTKTVLQVTRIAQGGMSNHLRLLAAELKSFGWNVLIAGPSTGESTQTQAISPDLPLPIHDGLNPRKDGHAIFALRRYLRKNPVHLLHAHGWKAGLIAALARFGLPHLPLLVTVHNSLPPQFRGYRQWLLKKIGAAVLKRADRVIVVSSALSELAEKLYPPTARKLHLIPNGIDVDSLHATSLSVRNDKQAVLKKFGLTVSSDFLIGTVTRIIREKGVFELVEAFDEIAKTMPNTRLLIIGDGPAREELILEISRLHVASKIHLLGWIRNAAYLMGIFDVFVLPSWSEGMPISIMEAMAAGVPVIASNVGGIPELISDGVTGSLVPARDSKRLAKAILDLLNNPKKRQQFGQAAYETISARFKQDAMVNQIAEIYKLMSNA